MKKILNSDGFSFVEILIAIVLLGVVLSLIAFVLLKVGASQIKKSNHHTTPITKSSSVCIEGFKFVVNRAGQSQQIINENGGGIPCDK